MTDSAERVYRSLLVLRCQTGDATAFAELLALHQVRLHYFLQKMLGDPHRADDLFQEVWLDVFRGIGRLADPAAFAGWLYQVARHRAYRELRKRREPLHPLGDADLPQEDDADDFGAEDAELVHACLDRLAAAHREVLLLRFVEEMSYEEIAGVVGCQVGTVRSRLHYAKRALRQLIERTMIHD
jgi:RNA polymerase sigma-70 factor (ECF subfamily)